MKPELKKKLPGILKNKPPLLMKIWVLISAYDEAERIKPLLEELKIKKLPVLVIDDGSKDNTYETARRVCEAVVKNKKNLGKGAALRCGLNYLLKNEEFDYVIMMDADGQHSPGDLEGFLNEASKGESFVVGNRMRNTRGMPPVRILTNKFMSWLISRIIGQKVFDTQCGFRMLSRLVLEKINITTDRFEIETELLMEAARNGFSIKSLPIKTIYFQKQNSKINHLLDTFRFISFILRRQTSAKGTLR